MAKLTANGWVAERGNLGTVWWDPDPGVFALQDGTPIAVGDQGSRMAGPVYMAGLGDSITERSHSSTVIGSVYFAAAGYLSWVQALTMQRVTVPLVRRVSDVAPVINYNRAVSGETTVETIARINEVLALTPRPRFCAVLGGTNDLALRTSDTAVDIFGRLMQICATLRSNGITPVLITVIPRGQGATGWISLTGGTLLAQQRKLLELNRLIRGAASVVSGTLVVDPYDRLADFSSAVGDLRSDMTSDFIHPNAMGAFEIGQAVQLALDPLLAPEYSSAQSALDVNGDLGPSLYQSSWSANGGTAGAGVTGDVPLGWTANRFAGATSTAVTVRGAKTNGRGNQWQATYTGGDTAQFRIYSGTAQFPLLAASWPAGVGIYTEADIDYAPGGNLGSYVDIYAKCINGGNVPQLNALRNDVAATGFSKPFVAKLRTPILVSTNSNDIMHGWTVDATINGSSHVSKWSNLRAAFYDKAAPGALQF